MTSPGAPGAAGTPPRVCVDLNVFVAAERAARAGKASGLSRRVLEAVERREITLVFSLNMAARLAERLEDRAGLSGTEAAAVVALYTTLADPPGLLTREQPVVALGEGPHAEEDSRVVEAALAGRADYLVTYNIADFLPAQRPPHIPPLGVRRFSVSKSSARTTSRSSSGGRSTSSRRPIRRWRRRHPPRPRRAQVLVGRGGR